MSKLDEQTKSDLKLMIGKAYQVPMSLVDGRPWVSTQAEAEAAVDEKEWE